MSTSLRHGSVEINHLENTFGIGRQRESYNIIVLHTSSRLVSRPCVTTTGSSSETPSIVWVNKLDDEDLLKCWMIQWVKLVYWVMCLKKISVGTLDCDSFHFHPPILKRKKKCFPIEDLLRWHNIGTGRYVVVSLSGGIWPQSPNARRTTRPLGRMAIQVMLELCRLILSQASGGNCRAL